MRIILVTLSNALFRESRLRLNASASKFGIADIRSYEHDEIKNTPFYLENSEILNQVRGMGYWLWKPYIILETLKTVADGDIVIYCDAGSEIINDLAPVIKICRDEQPVVPFGNGNHINSMWTKRDCFVLMDCDEEPYWNGLHCDASFILVRKNDLGMQFVGDWVRYGCDKRIMTDMPNTCGRKNFRDFIQHRYDQSILSVLAQKYNLSIYRMPSQYGNHYKMQGYRATNEFNCVNQLDLTQVGHYAPIPFYNSPYIQLLNHHRTRIPAAKGSFLNRMKAKFSRRIKKMSWILRNLRPYK